MSVLEYASKFMELYDFALAFVADVKLKINCFKAGLNPNIKKRMSMRQYTSYVDLCDTAANMERAIKERNNYFSENAELTEREISERTFTFKVRIRDLPGTAIITIMHMEANNPTIGLG